MTPRGQRCSTVMSSRFRTSQVFRLCCYGIHLTLGPKERTGECPEFRVNGHGVDYLKTVVSGYKSKSRNWLEMAASFGV
jgi:hypothetical protein